MARNDGAAGDAASLGEAIRQLRLKRGWTQQELAARAGVQQKQISSYERGATAPSFATLIALANALGVSLDHIAQLPPQGQASTPIRDRELFERVVQVDGLSDHDRNLVKEVIDLVIGRSRLAAAATSSQVGDLESDIAESEPAATMHEQDPVKRVGQKMGWSERRLQQEAKAARTWVRETLRLHPDRRRGRIERATTRFQGPLFCVLLLEEARRRIPGDPAEALSLADAVLAANSKKDVSYRPDPEIHAPALAVRGNAKRALGRLVDAEADLLEAQRLLDSPRLSDPATAAELYSYLGSLRKDQRRFEEAAHHLGLAATLYELLRDRERAARVLLNLGSLRHRRHEPAAAIAADREALDLLDADSAGWLRGYARFNLARHLHAAGETENAEAELAAHEDLIMSASPQLATLLVWLRAKIAWSRGDLDTAERLYTEARQRALDRGIDWDAGLVSLELALVHLVRGRTDRVRELAAEALRVFAEQEVERETGAALELLEAAARREAFTREVLEQAITAIEGAPHGRRAGGPAPA